MLRRKEVILYIILACSVYILTALQINSTFFIYAVAQWVLYFLFFCTIVYSLYKVLKDKRQVSLYRKLQSLLFGSCIAISFFIVYYLAETDGGKKIVLTAGFDGGLNFVTMDLRSDGSFKLINSGPFGGEIYRGKYVWRNDTLRIDNPKLKYLFPNLTFIVKQSAGKKYFEPIVPDSFKYKFNLYFQSRGL